MLSTLTAFLAKHSWQSTELLLDKLSILAPSHPSPPGGGHGNPLQCYWLENCIDRGAWWAIAHGVAKSQTRLNTHTHTHTHTYTHQSHFLLIQIPPPPGVFSNLVTAGIFHLSIKTHLALHLGGWPLEQLWLSLVPFDFWLNWANREPQQETKGKREVRVFLPLDYFSMALSPSSSLPLPRQLALYMNSLWPSRF